MLAELDKAQNVDTRVREGLGYSPDRSFNDIDLDTSVIGDREATQDQYEQYMRDLDVNNAMDIARTENNEGTRKEVIIPETFDIETSQRILDEFDDIDDLESEELINNNSINKAVQDKIKQIELSNYQNQQRVDEITKTAMETNNILNYILWLLDSLNIDIESIGDLIEEYKNLIVILRKAKRRQAQVSDQGTDTDQVSDFDQGTDTDDLPLREEEELSNYIEKYEILLSKYKDLVGIIRDHNINDIDLSLLQDILTRNKYSSQLILDNLNNSIEKIRDYSTEGLPTTQSQSGKESDGKYNEKLFTSIYFIKKLADQLNIPQEELNSKYPIILLQGNSEIELQNERLNIQTTIEGLRLTAEILSDPENPQYNAMTANMGDRSASDLIELINDIISELNRVVNERTNQPPSPMMGGSLNIKIGILHGGASYKENLKNLGKEKVVDPLLSPDDGKTLEEKIKEFSMTTPKNNDFIKLKLRNDTLSKLLELSFKDFSFLLSQQYNDNDKSIKAIEDALSDDDMLLQIWNSKSPVVNEFVDMSKKLSTYDFDTDNKLNKFLTEIKKLSDDDDENKLAKIYMSLILDSLKEKSDLKTLSKQANSDTIKYTIFVMKLSGAVRHFLLNKTKEKVDSIKKIEEIVTKPEVADQYADRATLEGEVDKARQAVSQLLKQINVDKKPDLDSAIVDNRVQDQLSTKMIKPPETLGMPPTPRTLQQMLTPRPGAPPNTPRRGNIGRFADSEEASKITPASIREDTDIKKVIKTLKKYKKTLEQYSVTEEQISGDVKISEEQHKVLDEKRETIMSQSVSPKEKSRAILNDVIVPTLMEIKPGAEIQKKLDALKKPLSLQEFTDKITTSINQDIDDFPNDDNMGFEGDTDVYIVSRKLLPPIDMRAVGPMGSDFVALDTPPGSQDSTEVKPTRVSTPTVAPQGTTVAPQGAVGKFFRNIRFTGTNSRKESTREIPDRSRLGFGGKKHKTFKKKLRNRSKK